MITMYILRFYPFRMSYYYYHYNNHTRVCFDTTGTPQLGRSSITNSEYIIVSMSRQKLLKNLNTILLYGLPFPIT